MGSACLWSVGGAREHDKIQRGEFKRSLTAPLLFKIMRVMSVGAPRLCGRVIFSSRTFLLAQAFSLRHAYAHHSVTLTCFSWDTEKKIKKTKKKLRLYLVWRKIKIFIYSLIVFFEKKFKKRENICLLMKPNKIFNIWRLWLSINILSFSPHLFG